MREHRRFLRVNYLGAGWLHVNEGRYNCRLHNISNNGALVCLKKAPAVPINHGENCRLMLHQENKKTSYQEFDARIIRFESDVAALEFAESAIESDDTLDKLIRKELHFINGGKKLVDLGWKVAKRRGVGLTVVYFDKGELNPEREMHTLRLSVGKYSINVHLHREEIETFCVRSNFGETRAKICHAIDRLKAHST